MKALLLGFILMISLHASAQTYKSTEVFISEMGSYRLVGNLAFLDYNLKEKYVELIFSDSIYHYQIRKTGKPINKKRFLVSFANTPNTLLWNLEKEGHYFFAFKIENDFLWFKSLSDCTKDEITRFRTALLSRKAKK